jgi:protease-4
MDAFLSFDYKKYLNYLRWAPLALLSILAVWAGYAASAAAAPKPQIGVMTFEAIIHSSRQDVFIDPLEYALEHDEIAAVVILMDSPGGSAAVSEELYYRIMDLRLKKPVVTSISTIAASGGYYAAAGSDYIFTRPSAQVGNVGVIAGIKTARPVEEDERTTGPFKKTGTNEVDWVRGMEAAKNSFIDNVYNSRLYSLEHYHSPSKAGILPDKFTISSGRIWIGSEAVAVGIADALGSDIDAIQMAARLAHVSNYEVVDLMELSGAQEPVTLPDLNANGLAPDAFDPFFDPGLGFNYLEAGIWQEYYYLYIPIGN